MQSKNFIKNKLQELIEKYNNISIKYYFDKFDNDHFLIISPSEVLNDIVKNHAISIDLEFMDLFPSESLNFILSEEDESYDELVFSYIPKIDSVSCFNASTINDISIKVKDKKQILKNKEFRTYSLESYYSNNWINFKTSNKSANIIEDVDDIYAIAS